MAARSLPEPARALDAHLEALHDRAVAGDRGALDKVAELMLPYLRQRLKMKFHLAPDDAILDGAVDALMDYCGHPTSFDPALGRLRRFLFQASWRNVANSVRAAAARRAREERYAVSAASSLGHSASPLLVSSSPPGEVIRRDDLVHGLTGNCQASVAEFKALEVWLDGERKTQPLAQALGLAILLPRRNAAK